MGVPQSLCHNIWLPVYQLHLESALQPVLGPTVALPLAYLWPTVGLPLACCDYACALTIISYSRSLNYALITQCRPEQLHSVLRLESDTAAAGTRPDGTLNGPKEQMPSTASHPNWPL